MFRGTPSDPEVLESLVPHNKEPCGKGREEQEWETQVWFGTTYGLRLTYYKTLFALPVSLNCGQFHMGSNGEIAGHHPVVRSEQVGAQVLGPVDIEVHRWPVNVESMGTEGSPRMLQKAKASQNRLWEEEEAAAIGEGSGEHSEMVTEA
ncbi:hypothetical protein P7K49_024540 [Saguinus oedipus]|uniref:Uncharacterized protein n=1 Tax=Saguinus oedipus TaxID=9490 RepID=A0ABQ9UPT4_SAGOE|nr:hypothetical protein P7K49_024540 [Saguinus oedipus]